MTCLKIRYARTLEGDLGRIGGMGVVLKGHPCLVADKLLSVSIVDRVLRIVTWSLEGDLKTAKCLAIGGQSQDCSS